jgi:hypothetical protein
MSKDGERDAHFMYYMRSLLKQLQTMFPECISTALLCEKLANDNTAQGAGDLVAKWQNYMGTPETIAAIRAKDVAKVLENNNPIMSMLQIKSKFNDPRLSENSRKVLWQFIEKLNDLALETASKALDIRLPPPPSSSSSSSSQAMLLSTSEPLEPSDIAIPAEMAPLIDLAKSFMQKIPEEDLEQMYGSIATISQSVLKNYEGQLPPEFGGDYFAKVLRQTFRQ